MKYLLSIIFVVGLTLISHAQNLSDAVRYSSLYPGGTARVMGAGSAFGAMGGDMGVLTINPAGLGDFRSSELAFTFSFTGGNSESSLMNGTALRQTHIEQPEFENIGIVFHSSPSSASLKTSNFSIGLQQLANFNEEFSYAGETVGSITERFAELANGRTEDALDLFEADLALLTGAIYDFDGDLVYETDFTNSKEVYKQQSISRDGQINELSLAWAGKFANNLNLGIGIGIPFISFEEVKLYEEIDQDDRHPAFDNLAFQERLSTSGTGFNFKLGANYTLEKTLRLGLAYQSPTYYSMRDNFDTQLTYSFNQGSGLESYTENSPNGRFSYRLNTPSRITASIGALLSMDDIKGFINLDASKINYRGNQFDFTIDNNDPSEAAFEREVNNDIELQLQSSYNFNLGTEWVFDHFRLRGGIGFVGSPYELDGANEYSKIYSLGAGYRADRFFLDVSWQKRNTEEGYIPYLVLDQDRLQNVDVETNLTRLAFTIGFKI